MCTLYTHTEHTHTLADSRQKTDDTEGSRQAGEGAAGRNPQLRAAIWKSLFAQVGELVEGAQDDKQK